MLTLCLLFFAYQVHPRYRLILGANRDEFYHRPTEPAHFWESSPGILGGRDLEMLGTWMGITRSGRFSALTNFRDPSSQIENPKSRGQLVKDYLESRESPEEYLAKVIETQSFYNPFNILVGDLRNLMYFSNQSPEVRDLKPGFYALSNHFLDTPWPKVRKSKQALFAYLEGNQDRLIDSRVIFEILADTEQAYDHELPSTGIGYPREKMLSSIFIRGTDYGTRSSTVLCLDRENTLLFQERTFRGDHKFWDEVSYSFKLID
ncbi:NRDE family protein [Candidatus Desulfosporosinus nitrosoreducens]|uniref:NRDE family protein n=1 Tax=Candidatus Desulfosporosinus nitrosoreducens TaxID=3401928 RepID=UPI00280A7DCC|nr:NRDE family protein [Desulfosporosinus sp. PR]